MYNFLLGVPPARQNDHPEKAVGNYLIVTQNAGG
jgi:hypothetical protein